MRCTNPRLLQVGGRPGVMKKPMHVGCGRCQTCRLHARNEAAAQAAMEGVYVREKLGVGHIWMATLTLDTPNLDWHEPVPHNFQNWLPRLKPNSRSKASGLRGPERAKYQGKKVRKLYGMDGTEAARYRHGKYARIVTLNKEKVRLYRLRLNKRFGYRAMVAGEYGEKHGRPHWHMLVFGLNRDEFCEALRMWPHGHTDPNPDTVEGGIMLDKQDKMNRQPGAAAKYMTAYLKKLDLRKFSAAEFAREHAYIDRQCIPAMGLPFAKKVISPRVAQVYDANCAWMDDSAGGRELAAYHAMKVSSVIKIDGWFYPMTRSFRRKIIEESGISEDVIEAASWLAVEVEQTHLEMVEQYPEYAALYEAEMKRNREAEALRDARYAEALVCKETEWQSNPLDRAVA